jgi:hypothetical protein
MNKILFTFSDGLSGFIVRASGQLNFKGEFISINVAWREGELSSREHAHALRYGNLDIIGLHVFLQVVQEVILCFCASCSLPTPF